ncbi:hypothetical protein [Virgisporangium aurantiacum]|uniref:hypothetical protein n=1 Tax=Virgisporangium aurantiacum TaxID=175570 RepID=UPI00195043AB|nr:hypothetical protein [Virgisporangium aurantiacum]
MADIVANLGFVLAIDHCARGCLHCPAFGDRTPVQRAPLADLARRVASVAAARRSLTPHDAPTVDHPIDRPVGTRVGRLIDRRVVHCWRISDPLDYATRLPSGGVATCVDVARLWREHLGQGLYVVTNGSEGAPAAGRALADLVAAPDLVSQMKLTVTHADRSWDSPRYVADMARDVAVLAPLWDLRATRAEDENGRRFRINVKTTAARRAEVRTLVVAVLVRAGLSRSAAQAACDDGSMVRFKPIYDLGNATGAPSPVDGAVNIGTGGQRYKPTTTTRKRIQYGIRPDGRLFVVDMFAFTEHDLGTPDTPVFWPTEADLDMVLSTDPTAGQTAGLPVGPATDPHADPEAYAHA